MATTKELNGLIKGLADAVKSQEAANSTAFQQTTEHLQTLSSTVQALSKSIAPQSLATQTQSNNDSPAGLRLPSITLPVFKGPRKLG